MIARTRLNIALKLCAFTLVGMFFGTHAGRPLDNIFTDGGTIAIVGSLLGAWAGAMIGGSGWADVASSYRRQSRSKIAAWICITLAIATGIFAVVRNADSSALIAGFQLGAAIMAYLLARETKYRFVIAALLLGAFAGTAISAAGGEETIERALRLLNEEGIEAVVASAQSGDLRHFYLGRDREEALLIGVIVGYIFVCFATMITFGGLGLIGITVSTYDRKANSKTKRG